MQQNRSFFDIDGLSPQLFSPVAESGLPDPSLVLLSSPFHIKHRSEKLESRRLLLTDKQLFMEKVR